MNQLLPLTSNNKGLLYETASCIASIQREFFQMDECKLRMLRNLLRKFLTSLEKPKAFPEEPKCFR